MVELFVQCCTFLWMMMVVWLCNESLKKMSTQKGTALSNACLAMCHCHVPQPLCHVTMSRLSVSLCRGCRISQRSQRIGLSSHLLQTKVTQWLYPSKNNQVIGSLDHWIWRKDSSIWTMFFSVKQRVAPQEIDDTIIYNYHCPYWNIEMAIWEGLKLLSLPLHWREHILVGFIGRKIMKNLDMFGASN